MPSGSSDDCAGVAVVGALSSLRGRAVRHHDSDPNSRMLGTMGVCIGFSADVDVSGSEDGLVQGTDGLADLGDVVIDIGAVVEGFVCDRPEVTKLVCDYNEATRGVGGGWAGVDVAVGVRGCRGTGGVVGRIRSRT